MLVLMKYLKGGILDLIECCLCLGDVFYFSSIYILSEWGQKKINCVLKNKKRTNKVCVHFFFIERHKKWIAENIPDKC